MEDGETELALTPVETTEVEWNARNEIALFKCALAHKPTGINKHFHMASILENFKLLTGLSVTSDILWQHIKSMYDTDYLDKKEAPQFLHEEEDYELPEEYKEMIEERVRRGPPPEEPLPPAPPPPAPPAPVAKVMKEETRPKEKKEPTRKKEEQPEPVVVEKESSPEESEEEESPDTHDTPPKADKDTKKKKQSGVGKKEKATPQRRVTRSIKDEKESSPATPSSKKTEEEKEGKGGRRSLRPRGDDKVPSATPPRAKRARRI